MGTMVGDDSVGNRVGVAPSAQWIAVKLFDNSGFTLESWIHDAFQWVIAAGGRSCTGARCGQQLLGQRRRLRYTLPQRCQSATCSRDSACILPGNRGPGKGTIGSPELQRDDGGRGA